MEDLTKHQLILLVLLVTFVTSIATGIITFSLLSEAPVEITQTIDRVVEKTIEKVVPVEGQPQKVVTTVVVNEEEKVLESISKNEKSIVRIKSVALDGTQIFTGIGIVVDSTGTIVSDIKSYVPGNSYLINFSDGKSFSTGRVYIDHESSLVFIKTSLPKNSEKYTFYPAVFGNSDDLKIGQMVIAVTGKESNAASVGRIFQIITPQDKTAPSSLLSDIELGKSYTGSPLLNLSGEIVALEAPALEGETKRSFSPINSIKPIISSGLEALSK